MRIIAYLLSVLLSLIPLRRWHSCAAWADDLCYVAKYGRGRYLRGDRWCWFYSAKAPDFAAQARGSRPGFNGAAA
jgi:hypothetical protein